MDKDSNWFCEGTVPGRRYGKIDHCFKIDHLVYEGKTKFQNVLIFDNSIYGRILVLDDIVQFSRSDEVIYHEMLTHPVLLTHPNPEHILIIGGGDGGTLRECLKHDPARVTMVDIDAQVIELAKEHLAFVANGSWSDPRLSLHHENGIEFIRKFDGVFDAVFVDCGDPVGPSLPLFEEAFYKDIATALKPDGVVGIQVGSFLDPDLLSQTYQRLGTCFPVMTVHRLTMPSYHCGEYCFMGASNGPDLSSDKIVPARYQAMKEKNLFNYYTPDMHFAAQTLPPGIVFK